MSIHNLMIWYVTKHISFLINSKVCRISKRTQQQCISLDQRAQQVVHVADVFIQRDLQYTCYRNNPFRISLGLGVLIEAVKEQLQPLRHITPTARQSPTEIHLCLLNEERKSYLEEKARCLNRKQLVIRCLRVSRVHGWMSVPPCFPEFSEALMSLFFDRVIKFTLRESVSIAKKKIKNTIPNIPVRSF